LKEINEGRQKSNYTKLNEGILSDLDKSYLAVGRKVQKVLAETLHRLCEVAIKDKGNDLQDVKTLKKNWILKYKFTLQNLDRFTEEQRNM
jgi:hypothetical protein